MSNELDEPTREIVRLVGGPENIEAVTHCATRLRFNLKDATLPARKDLMNNVLVGSIIESGGQFQLLIGTRVDEVHDTLQAILSENDTSNLKQESAAPARNDAPSAAPEKAKKPSFFKALLPPFRTN